MRSLSDEDCKRSAGGQRPAFAKMLEVAGQGLRNFGRPSKLSRPDQLLRWRECRAEVHIGLAYGVSEAAACRPIQKIENALVKPEQFHLPGRNGLQLNGMKLEI